MRQRVAKGSAPRRRAAGHPAVVFLLLLGSAIVVTGVAAYLAVLTAHDQKIVDGLRAHGVVTEGVVTAVDERWTRTGTSYGRTVSYLDGRITQDVVGCPCQATVGAPVTVVYEGDRPNDAMTVSRLKAWSAWAYLVVVVPGAFALMLLAATGTLLKALATHWYQVARHGDPKVLAAARRQRAREYIDFVNKQQRRPDANGDPSEAALARWWDSLRAEAPTSHEAQLVADVLAITRL